MSESTRSGPTAIPPVPEIERALKTAAGELVSHMRGSGWSVRTDRFQVFDVWFCVTTSQARADKHSPMETSRVLYFADDPEAKPVPRPLLAEMIRDRLLRGRTGPPELEPTT